MYLYWFYYALGFVMIPGIILGIWAQTKVQTTFNEYNNVPSKQGKTAKDVVRLMLDSGGCEKTGIKQIDGELTDNFNPKENTISLSSNVYSSNSISAIGVACHEVGHAFQYNQNYKPLKIRNNLVPVLNFANFFTWPLIFIGFMLEFSYYVTAANWLLGIGVGIYALSTIFCLITLPVELNASKRAAKMLLATGEMDKEEINGVKKVLNAAAWTYVASLITSILSLLRLVLFIFAARGSRD